MSAMHSCLRAKREQLVRELNRVMDAQLNYLRHSGRSLHEMICQIGSDGVDPEFQTLLDREEIINLKIERIDAQITE